RGLSAAANLLVLSWCSRSAVHWPPGFAEGSNLAKYRSPRRPHSSRWAALSQSFARPMYVGDPPLSGSVKFTHPRLTHSARLVLPYCRSHIPPSRSCPKYRVTGRRGWKSSGHASSTRSNTKSISRLFFLYQERTTLSGTVPQET